MVARYHTNDFICDVARLFRALNDRVILVGGIGQLGLVDGVLVKCGCAGTFYVDNYSSSRGRAVSALDADVIVIRESSHYYMSWRVTRGVVTQSYKI